MPEIAKRIEIAREGDNYRFEIDGQEFPWYITEDGVRTTVHRNGMPAVTITIIADEVQVRDAPRSEGSD